jgi:hypothetical protein
MTTLSIHHRPAPFIAAAAAVAAIAAGSMAVAVSHDAARPSAPAQRSHTSVPQDTTTDHFHPTTSGGHVMLGV